MYYYGLYKTNGTKCYQVKYDDSFDKLIVFPQTIGDITFYNKTELFEWVINQQKMNKNPDYGRGIYS